MYQSFSDVPFLPWRLYYFGLVYDKKKISKDLSMSKTEMHSHDINNWHTSTYTHNYMHPHWRFPWTYFYQTHQCQKREMKVENVKYCLLMRRRTIWHAPLQRSSSKRKLKVQYRGHFHLRFCMFCIWHHRWSDVSKTICNWRRAVFSPSHLAPLNM